MATRPAMVGGQHTAGIYSDMTVDGPEIGTLVLIVDRAKNLPSRRAMGKQDPYCAARLGKEAKKTKTDFRGGQTPRWDQELRFTVHESPDYNNLKLSVFNDDKKTDLIGEAWINLVGTVLKPGGGRKDDWHHLNYKGKYAGEVRVEMSYYDSRAPERPPPEAERQSSSVKRRPLPAGPAQTVVPQFGPRTIGCARGTTVFLNEEGHRVDVPLESQEPHRGVNQIYPEVQSYSTNTMQPDYLPQIPPRSTPRSSQPSTPSRHPAIAEQLEGPMLLAHSHSTPDLHAIGADSYYPIVADDNEYHPDLLDYANATTGLDDQFPGQLDHYGAEDPSHYAHSQPAGSHYTPSQFGNSWHENEQQDVAELPPLPPSHGSTPQQGHRQSYGHSSHVSSVSPLQSIERSYAAHSSAATGTPLYRSQNDHQTSARHSVGATPPRRALPSPSQASIPPHSSPLSPTTRSVDSSPGAGYSQPTHPGMSRHSVSDPYASTPPRGHPHPLSQEVRRSTSPQPYHGNAGYTEPRDFHFPEDIPVIRPMPQSPRMRHSIGSIRHPVQTFSAKSNGSAANRTVAQHAERMTPPRKSVSPQPSAPVAESTRSMVPFSPDSFDTYNPSSRGSQLDAQPSPHNPYHIPVQPRKAATSKDNSKTDRNPDEPILSFDGRMIDPSDHLPVDSWAPEPETKTPPRTYGAGNVNGFGPRSSQISPVSTPGSGPRKSNIVVNVRHRQRVNTSFAEPAPVSSPPAPGPSPLSSSMQPPSPESATRVGNGRNRLVKKNAPPSPTSTAHQYSSGYTGESPGPLREIDIPNLHGSRYGGGGGRNSMPDLYGRNGLQGHNGDSNGSPRGGAPPPKPPKIPFDTPGGVDGGDRNDRYGVRYGDNVLSQEMAKIDIGGSRGGAARGGAFRSGRPGAAAVGMRHG